MPRTCKRGGENKDCADWPTNSGPATEFELTLLLPSGRCGLATSDKICRAVVGCVLDLANRAKKLMPGLHVTRSLHSRTHFPSRVKDLIKVVHMPYILAVKQHIIPVEAVQRVEGIGGGKARSGCQDSYLIREGCQKPYQRALQSVCSWSPISPERGKPRNNEVS